MASAEREPITGVWGGVPSGVQGQSPWSGGQPPLKPESFGLSTSSGSGTLPFCVKNVQKAKTNYVNTDDLYIENGTF